MLTRFLFWNVGKRPLDSLISAAASEWNVDVLILAECAGPAPSTLGSGNPDDAGRFRSPTRLGHDLRLYTRLPGNSIRQFSTDTNGHLATYRIVRPQHPEVLVATIHYQSRRDWDPADQDLHAPTVADAIRRQERRAGHRRTLVVGDFNMNPFDRGLVAAPAFHAVMTRDLARDRERTVDARKYDMFYNPMWRFFGDHSPGPAGTYWYRPAKPVVYGWNLYDQLLLRPDLMDRLADLRILDRIGDTPLLRNGRPDRSGASDHLPLYFAVDL